jgi:Zn-dependent peptidase ImmA (M78 family)/transcriptional regulator with XRE-family HTH domain
MQSSRSSQAAADFSGDRLRLARYRAGLNIRELAETVGLSSGAISQYETGRATPTPAGVARLAMATGVPAAFLTFGTRAVSMAGLEGTHFRSLRSTSKQTRANAWTWSEMVLDLTQVLERYVRLPTASVPVHTLVPGASREEFRAAAALVRKEWALPDGPVGHLARHMEMHGIVISRLTLADGGIDAFSQYQSDHPVVVLGENKGDIARSRFDLAHELGHLVCHPEADPGGTQENQAHGFAAELLMPEEHMRAVLPRRYDLGTYVKLKQEWGVSIAALLFRARALEVITDVAYRRAVVALNSQYGRRNEPFPLQSPDDPSLLAQALALAESNGISLDSIANEAHIALEDAEAIVAGSRARPIVTL